MAPGNRRVSAKVERQRARRVKERALDRAAASYREACGSKISVRKHAENKGVSYKRLLERLSRKQTRTQSDAQRSLLGAEESQRLIDWLVQQAERGFPLTDAQIKELANHLIRKVGNVPSDWEGVGKDWVRRFRDRNEEQLGRYWSKALDRTRASGLSAEHVVNWFQLLSLCILDGNVPPHRIFAMDESGMQISVLLRQMVTGGKLPNGKKKTVQHRQGSNNRELITVIVTICADGTVLPPSVIFKGTNLRSDWIQDNPLAAHPGMSEKGYANNVIGLAWMKIFEADTRASAPGGEKRVLIVDGHGSHCTAEALEFAQTHNIEVLGYPPHTTHALQGLDVVMFAPFKAAYTSRVNRFEEEEDERATKANFLTLLAEPFRAVFTKDNILSAFRKTGVWPVDSSVITPEQTAPAVANSMNARFAWKTPSPVKAITSWMFPATPRVARHSSPNRSAGSEDDIPTAPVTPTRQESTPVQHTMADRGRFARTALSDTSASFLLSDDLDGTERLPSPTYQPPGTSSPDWNMAKPTRSDSAEVQKLKAALAKAERRNTAYRRHVSRSNATMALQHVHVDKLNKKLVKKKAKRKDIRTVIFKSGNGALLTSAESIRLLHEDQDSRTQAAADKATRKVEREAKRAEAAAEKERKLQVRNAYNEAVRAWKEKCERIRAANPGKKRGLKLPKKPAYPFAKGSRGGRGRVGEDNQAEESGESGEDSAEEPNNSSGDEASAPDDDIMSEYEP